MDKKYIPELVLDLISYKNLKDFDNLPEKEGLYSFWINRKEINSKTIEYQLKGAKDSLDIIHNINDENEYVLVYIGKTFNIKKRIKQHIQNNKKISYAENDIKIKTFNGKSKVRSCVEYLFKDEKSKNFDYLRENKNIKIKFIEIECAKERFYYENLAIGLGKPFLNVDIER